MTSVSTDRRFGVNSGKAIKVACVAATISNITLSGNQTIDGVSCITNDRVLVKSQTTGSENGIWVVDTGAWSRAVDFDDVFDVTAGTLVPVLNGTVNSNSMWRVTTTGTITPGTTSISFAHAMFSDSLDISFLQSGTGAVAYPVQTKLRDSYSVKDFGATGDGVNNDSTAIQAALTAAVAAGKNLHFPAGTYLSNALLSSNGASVSITGDGVGVTKIIFTATTGGFSFGLDAQSAGVPPDQLYLNGFTIEARANVSTSAINATWSAYQPNAQGSSWISDINIVRKADGTGSFAAGIRLEKCIVGVIDRVVMIGDDSRVSVYGFELVDCVGLRFSSCDVNRYQTAARLTVSAATQSEGILFRDCLFYDVNRGINVASQAIHINVIGCHININGTSAVNAITFTTVSQSTVIGNLIYIGGSVGHAANQDGIYLSAGSGNVVESNTIVGTTIANTRNSISTQGGSSYNSIGQNGISFCTTGVNITAVGDTGNRVVNNDFYSCTTNVTNSGTSTHRRGNTSAGIPIADISRFLAYCSAGQAINATTATKLNFQTEVFDDISEFASNTFTAAQAGDYMFTAAVTGTQVVVTRRLIDIYVNGVASFRLAEDNGSTGITTLSGSIMIRLTAGQTVDVYYYTGQADTTIVGQLYTYFTGHRLIS